MKQNSFTSKQTALYSALPNGYTDRIAVKNALPQLTPEQARRILNDLSCEGFLKASQFTITDADTYRKHCHSFYRVTAKGLAYLLDAVDATNTTPTLTALVSMIGRSPTPTMKSLVIPSKNAVSKERELRVVEVEQFCAASDVLTQMDRREASGAAVFGSSNCAAANSEENNSLDLRSLLCEAAKRGNQSEVWNSVISENIYAEDPYAFYRAKECTDSTYNTSHQSNSNGKNPALIRSTFIGTISNRARAFLAYRAPKYGGLAWVASTEAQAALASSIFCSRNIPQSRITPLHPISDSLLFYNSERELLNVIRGTQVKFHFSIESLGLPYNHLYAIPFDANGRITFESLLENGAAAYEEAIIAEICEADPFFNRDNATPLFPLTCIETPCFLGATMDVVKIAQLLSRNIQFEYCIVGHDWQKKFYNSILPDISFLII